MDISTSKEMDHKEQVKEPKKKNKIGIVVVAILVMVLAGGLIYKTLESIDLTDQNELTQQQLDQAFDELDSMSNELDVRILEISQLGGEIDTLLQIKNQLEAEKKAFRKKAYAQINDLQGKVDGYKELLIAQDVEIERLKKANVVLLEENTELKDEANELNNSIKELNSSKGDLEMKVALASQLRIEGMQIIAVSDKGKERLDNIKNRHIDHLKIQFDVLENKVAPIEGKDILLRITAPDGKVIFDVASGSGSFIFEDRESFYTAKKEILYDRNTQSLTYLYSKGSEYELGTHNVEVFTGDYKMGNGEFLIK
ncbi:MAG: chromosome segregation protein SMC [Reichenbachiella sp.]